jgi:hypothetical protein
MSKPKFEIDDAVKIGYGSKVYYVQQIEQDSNGFWAYALKSADGSTPRTVESMLSKASLLDDKAIKAKTVCFGQALEALKMGGKVFREKWTGKILWAWLERGIENRFMAKFAGLTKAPYTMSEEDLLACDWVIMTEEEKSPYPDRIPVPASIKFYGWMDWKMIVSPNGKLLLRGTDGTPEVFADPKETCTPGRNIGKAYLVPCKREDLKPGDIAYRLYPGDDFKPEIIKRYCVILNDLEYAYWAEEMDMQVNSFDKLDWYKVIFE